MTLANLIVLVALGTVLFLLGAWGRRNADSLGAVPGMPEEHEERRIIGMRRGATTCAVVGAAFVVVGLLSPLLAR
ncbi:MAG: hypothetical protein ACT4RN_16040 [Pseudonocardia sp.]